MALKDAYIGLFPSAGGRGGGGMVTVYDQAQTKAQINAAGYWNAASNEDAGTQRQRVALENFIALQQNQVGASGTGVICFVIGSDGEETKRAGLRSNGRVAIL